jgi:hypothetical protein
MCLQKYTVAEFRAAVVACVVIAGSGKEFGSSENTSAASTRDRG